MNYHGRHVGHDKILYAIKRSAVQRVIENARPKLYEYFWFSCILSKQSSSNNRKSFVMVGIQM
jgi:hypothetical protein